MVENVLSLFSGSGGGVEGFKQAGYNVVGAVDLEEDCIKTLQENHPDVKVIQEDLSEISPHVFAEKYNINPDDIDIVIGGPPCQGFSLSGHRDVDDSRNTLISDFIDFVEFYQPEYSVMENVTGILTMDTESGDSVVGYIHERFDGVGYALKQYELNAANYGVPQNRNRVFFVGHKNSSDITKPLTTTEKTKITIDEVLSINTDGAPNNDRINSSQRTIEKMKELDHGECPNKGETPRRLYPDKPSWTITATGSPPIHPHEPRKLTRREMAVIQSFPVDYKFCGSKTSVQRQIGNAAPPKLMKAIAEAL